MGYESAEESLRDLSPLREEVVRVNEPEGMFSETNTSSSFGEPS